ncbi:unnamed protein product [Pleuronectes platessa]|uniref:Uncharacterized protein n=1 Tax=Pleuronectes platessa TaxID=8262 RepID=A0A9N7UIW9_PLEPL|nr:unnamed protein product [Pleuronectes platessa]
MKMMMMSGVWTCEGSDQLPVSTVLVSLAAGSSSLHHALGPGLSVTGWAVEDMGTKQGTRCLQPEAPSHLRLCCSSTQQLELELTLSQWNRLILTSIRTLDWSSVTVMAAESVFCSAAFTDRRRYWTASCPLQPHYTSQNSAVQLPAGQRGDKHLYICLPAAMVTVSLILVTTVTCFTPLIFTLSFSVSHFLSVIVISHPHVFHRV